MWIASLRVSVAVSLVFILLAVTFIVLGIGNSGDNTDIIKIGGWLGIATAIAAWSPAFTKKRLGGLVLRLRVLNHSPAPRGWGVAPHLGGPTLASPTAAIRCPPRTFREGDE
jgi:hypothetical protein